MVPLLRCAAALRVSLFLILGTVALRAQVDTNITIVGDPFSATYGGPLSPGTATVNTQPGVPAPTGSLSVYAVDSSDVSTLIATLPVNPNFQLGSAPPVVLTGLPMPAGALPASTVSLRCDYSGDFFYNPAITFATLTISQATPNVGLNLNPNPVTIGHPETLTAIVSPPGNGQPTGTVLFLDGGNPITGSIATSTVALNTGTAQFNTSSLTVGQHTISFSYSGDGNFNPRAFAPGTTLNVLPIPTVTIVSSSAGNTFGYGTLTNLHVNVTPLNPNPPFSPNIVKFMDGTTVLGTVSVIPNTGDASLNNVLLSAGVHSQIFAVFVGDNNWVSASGLISIINVTKANPSFTLVGSPFTAPYAGLLTSGSIVVSNTGSGAAPTGTITAFVAGAQLQVFDVTHAMPLAGLLLPPAAAAGSQPLTYFYSGDSNYNIASGGGTVNITKAAPSVFLSLGPNPLPSGQSETLTAHVNSPTAGTPTGSVTFTDSNSSLNGTATVSNGTATFSTVNLAPGSHFIKFTYAGDTNFQGAQSNTASVTVNNSLIVTTTSLSSGKALTTYSASVAAANGLPPYSFAVSGLPSGLGINASTGVISGTPMASGNFPLAITVTDSLNATATGQIQLSIGPPPVVVSTAVTLPNGIVGVGYSGSVAANGGTAPFTFSFVDGTLPPGLSFNNGTLAGTPTKAGDYSFTIRVTDADNQTATQQFTVTIQPAPLGIGGGTFSFTVGTTVNTNLGCGGGTPPYSYSFSGQLPPGISFGNCVLSGTPTATGDFSIHVTITDSTGASGGANIGIIVAAQKLTLSGSALGDGQVGVAYAGGVSAAGGAPPISYSASGLPDGLGMSGSGAISGTPSTAGGFSFQVTATDSLRTTATGSFSINIAPATPSSLLFATTVLSDATVTAAYSDSLSATGGTQPYTFTVTGLPSGLKAGNDGVVSGTPDTAGTFTVGGTVTDSSGARATGSFSIKVSVCACLTNSAAQGAISTVAGTDFIFADDGKPAANAGLAGPMGLAADNSGNLYIADPVLHMVLKIDSAGIVTVVAGNGLKRYVGDGGQARAASLAAPSGVAVDSAGNVYIADQANNVVRRVSPNGIIATVAGNAQFGFSGDGGAATQASLASPAAVAVDSAGNIYVADAFNQRIRRVTPAGIITTFAGGGATNSPAARAPGDGGPATSVALSGPVGLALDSAGNLYIAEQSGNRIRKIAPNGIISTVAGGSAGFSGDGGPATDAALNGPSAIAVDAAGNLYIADTYNQRLRKVNAAGTISTIAGTGQSGFSGDGAVASGAALGTPAGVAIDAGGNVYIADQDNDRIRRINSADIITTFAGRGALVGDGGPATSARLDTPQGVALDTAGNLYITDSNQRVRRVTPTGSITTIAGTGRMGYTGDGGPGTSATFNGPTDLQFDSFGNLYIADTGNNAVRKLSATGTISTYASGITSPGAIALDAAGNLFVADNGHHTIRKVTPAGAISTIAGNGSAGFFGDGGPAAAASFGAQISGLLADASGNLFVVDALNYRVRKIATNGIITTFAGNGSPDLSGDGGPATAAGLAPRHLSQDVAGNIYITARNTVHVVRSDGTIHRYAGAAQDTGFSGEGGTALSAIFANLQGAVVSPSANVYVADTDNRRIRLIPANLGPLLLPSQTGLTFFASTAGGAPPAQTFTIVNAGQGTLKWALSTSTLSGGNWLAVSPAAGASAAGLAGPPVQVTVNAAGLAAGDYYGQIQILSPGVANSPQSVTIVLSVRAPGATTGTQVQPVGLLFTATSGASPAGQVLVLSTLSATPVSFTTTSTNNGQSWFTFAPVSGSVTSGKPAAVRVTPNTAGHAAGVYTGSITFTFSDGTVQTAQLLLVIAPGSGLRPDAPGGRPAACTPSKLLPLFTSLGSGFSITTGWPSPVELRVVDDCAQPLVNGSVTVSFSNTDPPLTLNSLGDSRWTGTWLAQNTAASVNVSAAAVSADQSLAGSTQVSGGLNKNNNPPPVVAAGGALNSASYQLQGPLAPGALISIFGSLLSQGTVQAPGLPLTNSLGGASVSIAGRTLPLLYASPGQINAIIPFDLPVSATQQLIVQRGTAISVPQTISVLSSQSGVFTQDLTGSGAGIVVRVAADGTQAVVSPNNPARAGDAIVIYCAGLGDVSPRQIAGQQATATQLSSTLDGVKVSIGGINAPVFFSGVTPGYTGLYQVNAFVPAGVQPGDNIALVVTQAGRSSPPVNISIR